MTGTFKKQTMAVSFICLSLMGAFTSCNKNDDPILPKGSSVEAVIDDDFKTIRMEWSEADSFCLYDGNSTFTFTRKGETATFVSEETPVTTNCCYAYYPANGVVSADKNAFTVNLPDIQEYCSGGLAKATTPMCGVSDNGSIHFKNLGAVLVFDLQTSQNGKLIESVTISADKPISGEFQLTHGDGNFTAINGKESLTLQCGGVELSDSEKNLFYIVIPSGTYEKIDLTFKTLDDCYADFSLSGALTFERAAAYYTTLTGKYFLDKETSLQDIVDEQIASGKSRFVSYIYDVEYAPGQFTNTLPAGLDTKEHAIEATANVIVGSTKSYVHLGGWGGSVTVGFDHPIINLEGADFRGYGNAFGGSSEPGVYYVAQKDAEGKPAKWYLIRHSMYDYSIHDYTITYYKPEAEDLTQYAFLAWDGTYASGTTNVVKAQWSKITEIESKDPECPVWYLYNNNIYKDAGTSTATIKKFHKANCLSDAVSDENQIPDTYQGYPVVYCYSTTVKAFDNYIYWEDNQGHNGYECKNAYHAQSYWPEYAGESITITGEYLPVNSFDTSGSGTNYVQDAKWWGFPLDGKGFGIGAYGFCDNYPNADPLSTIDISWAVDENGNSVKLDYIDFIKVQSGVHKQSGWIGEISTEFCGIEDLHILGEIVYPDTTVTPDIENIPRSNDPQQPDSGVLYWSYTPVDKR